ncbi:unnamed protein product, partial [Scytosiphon promiscuus]
MIWRQLNAGGSVWLTGHSKGGAVATTASSRLLFGDSAFKSKLAAMYNQGLHDVGGQHVRIKHNKADLVRKGPPIFGGMKHGGDDHH